MPAFVTLLALMLLVSWPSSSFADKRVALMVGNGRYANSAQLPNPPRDAEAVTELLRKSGFVVRQVIDVGNLAFKRALRDFSDLAQDSDIAAVYYAGHAIQIGDDNYLIPVDAKLEREYDAKDEAISLERVVEAVEPARRLRLIILDSCRDNPFSAKMQRRAATRQRASRGLARVEPTSGDTLIAFAAKAGSTAVDGEGDHSPFTTALLKHIAVPGLDIRLAFGRVRDDVLKITQNEQEPFVYGALGGKEISLVPAAALPETAPLPDLKGDYEPPVGALPETPKPSPAPDAAGPAPANLPARQQPPADPGVWSAWLGQNDYQKEVKNGGAGEALTREQETKLRPSAVFKDCATCPDMVIVASGTLMRMGPTAEVVTFAKPFAAGRYAITRDQFQAFVSATGYKYGETCHVEASGKWVDVPQRSFVSPGFAQEGNHPVVCVSWNDANEYVKWLSAHTGKTYRLLTEMEREYVTGAGNSTAYWWGDAIDPTRANYDTSERSAPGAAETGNIKKTKVASKDESMTIVGKRKAPGTVAVHWFQPNPWGFFNVHGNVAEWAQDCWNKTYTGAPIDGSAALTGDCTERVVRGGGWNHWPVDIRTRYREAAPLVNRYYVVGFRVARNLGE